MELKADFADGDVSSNSGLQYLWSLDEIDPKRARFPCCIVWTPLPVVSWLAPYIGHVGVCQEDGAILDFAGSNLVSMDSFAYGSVARYLQLDRKKCCLPVNLAAHVCKQSYCHSEVGAAISWDDALQSGMRRFQHKYYNLFTCNCHSFVANCLNRLAYNGSVDWNVLNVAALVWFHGQWVDKMSFVRSFFTFPNCDMHRYFNGWLAFPSRNGSILCSFDWMVCFYSILRQGLDMLTGKELLKELLVHCSLQIMDVIAVLDSVK